MTLLAIETSCDETSVAVVRDGRVLSSLVSSQIKLHAEYGGVVPELAAREHLRNLMPVTRAALEAAAVSVNGAKPGSAPTVGKNPRQTPFPPLLGERAGVRADVSSPTNFPLELDAIAATQGPGLPNALLLGLKAAQGMAFALRKPFIGIHHHEAHLYSPWIVAEDSRRAMLCAPGSADAAISGGAQSIALRKESSMVADFGAFEPNISLIVSGGHTMLVLVKSELEHQVLGATIDDATGECFDKVAKLIGLPYPGGPEIDRLAGEGNPKAYDFPRPMLRDPGDDFSFSGLKTSVRYFIRDRPEVLEDGRKLRDLCASVQAAIVEVLVTKTMRAAERCGVGCVTASGGVTCNRALRSGLEQACARQKLKLRLASRSLCTDNAAMIGILAERKFLHGAAVTSLDAEILPGWALA
jgi:N6-L-threonylcarbamoyladenine synthase